MAETSFKHSGISIDELGMNKKEVQSRRTFLQVLLKAHLCMELLKAIAMTTPNHNLDSQKRAVKIIKTKY